MKFQKSLKIRSITLFCLLVLSLLIFPVVSCNSEDQADKEQSGGSSSESQADIATLLPSKNAISGYEASGEPSVYTRQDVWDYLSRAAEVYLSNGFQSMAVDKFRGGDDDSLVVEIARFGDNRRAFGLFAMNREGDFTSVDLEPEGYIKDHALYYARGSYYLRIIGTPQTSQETLVEAAKLIVPSLQGAIYVHPALKYLPTEGMIPNTVQISITDDQIHNEQPDFVSSLYAIGSDTMRVFYQKHSRLGMTFAVEEFLENGGKVDEYLMGGEYQSLVGTSEKYGNVYCAVDGNSVCGVTGFSNREDAKTMARRVFEFNRAQ